MPYFQTDPVHLRAAWLQQDSAGDTEPDHGREFHQTPKSTSNPTKAGKSKDWSRFRKLWVNRDDIVAHRSHQNSERGKSYGAGHGGSGSGYFKRGWGGYHGGSGGRGGEDHSGNSKYSQHVKSY
jgi:hypothetical protein